MTLCTVNTFILYTLLYVYNSCWIKSDDGAIAAFVVPIVAIILVQFKITTELYQTDTVADQLYIFGHYSKGIMAT